MTKEIETDDSKPKRGRGALQIVALLAILYAAASIQTSIGTFIFVIALLVSALSIIRPIPSYGLPTRRYSIGVFFSVLIGGAIAIGDVANRHNEAHLVALKTSDPNAYLAELEKRGDQERWLEELRVLAPQRYPAEREKFDAEQARVASEEAEEEREKAQRAALEAEQRATENAAAAASTAAEEARNRAYGFHCLSTWDGSHPAIKEAVKSALRAPGSFEHIETSTFPLSGGQNKIVMTYRAQNGFGGMSVERAVGSFDNTTCDPRLETIE